MNYKGIKTYKVTNDRAFFGEIESTIQVDFNHPDVIEIIRQTVNFFITDKKLKNYYDGDVIVAFLKLLAAKIARIQAATDYNTTGVISKMKEEEGFLNIDGTLGVKLIYCEFISNEAEDFEVEEQEEKEVSHG
ncbi:DUF2528 family protein [Marinilabiliaceae bacterium JC017]|nr:DUF2528 family protein [Marinilabiliaceae bacterium JC017]